MLRDSKLDLSQDFLVFEELDEVAPSEREPEMLEMNVDKVCFVIIKAREYDIQEGELAADDSDDSNATDDNFALRRCRRVIGAVASHGDRPPLALFPTNEVQFFLGRTSATKS